MHLPARGCLLHSWWPRDRSPSPPFRCIGLRNGEALLKLETSRVRRSASHLRRMPQLTDICRVKDLTHGHRLIAFLQFLQHSSSAGVAREAWSWMSSSDGDTMSTQTTSPACTELSLNLCPNSLGRRNQIVEIQFKQPGGHMDKGHCHYC